MKTIENNGTKRSMALAIMEAYERVNGHVAQATFDKVINRLSKLTKERLQRYIDYIEVGNDYKRDAAYVILLGTGCNLPLNSVKYVLQTTLAGRVAWCCLLKKDPYISVYKDEAEVFDTKEQALEYKRQHAHLLEEVKDAIIVDAEH